MSRAGVAASFFRNRIEVRFFPLRNDLVSFVIEDDIAFGAAPFDAPGAVVRAVV